MPSIQTPIRRFLGERPAPVIDADATVAAAVGEMNRLGCDCVLVLGADGGLAGIFTERDHLNRVLSEGRDPSATALADVMTPDPEVLRRDDPVSYAINRMAIRRFRNVPVVDEGGRPVAVLGVRDVIRHLADILRKLEVRSRDGADAAEWAELGGRVTMASNVLLRLPATPIREVRWRKPIVVEASDRLSYAVAEMKAGKQGAVLVLVDGCLSGILTERDVIRRAGATPLTAWGGGTVAEWMTRNPTTVRADDSVALVVRLMSDGGFRRLPVIDSVGRPLGVVSIRDVLIWVAATFPEELTNLPPDPRAEANAPWGG